MVNIFYSIVLRKVFPDEKFQLRCCWMFTCWRLVGCTAGCTTGCTAGCSTGCCWYLMLFSCAAFTYQNGCLSLGYWLAILSTSSFSTLYIGCFSEPRNGSGVEFSPILFPKSELAGRFWGKTLGYWLLLDA